MTENGSTLSWAAAKTGAMPVKKRMQGDRVDRHPAQYFLPKLRMKRRQSPSGLFLS